MAGKDIVMLSRKELKRLHIVQKVFDKTIKQEEAAHILLLSPRQIRRLVKRVKREGESGIAHKSRGRASNRRISVKIKDKAIRFYRQKYHDFGPTLAAEKLSEVHRIAVHAETLRKWLIESGDWKKSRNRRAHRQWRERKRYFGEMVQIDGSHHDWFEGRGPQCVLLGYIDDATGNVFGRFYGYEGTMPAMDSFKCYIRKYGLPMSIYLDKHTTYKSPAKPSIADELEGRKPLSEFERALQELGVDVIHANTPQAKGRVERLFSTLQDRLIKEMRLQQIGTIEEANRFLRSYLLKHNKRFAVKAREKENLHRAIPIGVKLDSILCKRTQRTLRNDFTIAHKRKLYQVADNVRAKKVMVEERINGSMFVTYKDNRLRFKEISERPKPKTQQKSSKPRRQYTPPPDHPWKKYRIIPVTKSQQKELNA